MRLLDPGFVDLSDKAIPPVSHQVIGIISWMHAISEQVMSGLLPARKINSHNMLTLLPPLSDDTRNEFLVLLGTLSLGMVAVAGVDDD